LFALGEANFSDHGANRLGASALMQGLADGYFVIPYTLGNYLADDIQSGKLDTNRREFAEAEAAVKERIARVMSIGGTTPVDKFHRELGKVMWDKCGMARNANGLEQAISEIRAIREDFWKRARVPGTANEVNVELEKALRIADFLELGELLCIDARHRNESCGGHFREEYQTEEGEALRDDAAFSYVAAWQYAGPNEAPVLNKEPLAYTNIKVQARSYK
jgi:succinate dehydrogenase / fumarate reductase flavoprotein subunit